MRKTFLGSNIRALRKSKGIRMEDMAKDLGVHIVSVSHWENGRGMDVYNLVRICEYFHCNAESLLFTDLRKILKGQDVERVKKGIKKA